MTTTKRAPLREIFGWVMFDFANSAYTTVIITVVFAVIFPKIIVGPDAGTSGENATYGLGNLLWSVALSIGYLVMVLTAPSLGAIMDFSASKKKFLFASYMLTVVSCLLMVFLEPGYAILGVVLVVLSNVGFAAGESFVASFLPELAPPDDLGKISGYAWAVGYFGGLISTLLVLPLGPEVVENYSNLRWVGPITGIFFLLAAIPTFLFVKERGTAQVLPKGETYFTIGLERVGKTFKDIQDFKDLVRFLASLFFAQAGLAIVISFAFIYGDQIIKWETSTKVMMFVLTQLTAAGGAFLFGIMQDRVGPKATFNTTLVLWIVCVTAIWGTKDLTNLLNGLFGTEWPAQKVFLIVGCLAGMGIGSTQSASRALVALLSPNSKTGEFFGFWGLSRNLASIFGLLSLGVAQAQLGLETSILLCSILFIVALVINYGVDIGRGQKIASKHEGE